MWHTNNSNPQKATLTSTPRLFLLMEESLSRLMIEYGVGVGVQRMVKVMRLDGDYFEE